MNDEDREMRAIPASTSATRVAQAFGPVSLHTSGSLSNTRKRRHPTKGQSPSKSTRLAGAALRQATIDEEATTRANEDTQAYDDDPHNADDDDSSPLPQSDTPINRKTKDSNLFSSLLDILDDFNPSSSSSYDRQHSSHRGAGDPNSEDSSVSLPAAEVAAVVHETSDSSCSSSYLPTGGSNVLRSFDMPLSHCPSPS